MLKEYQNTELNAVFGSNGYTCKPLKSTGDYFEAKSVTEAAKKIMDKVTVGDGKTRDFAYNAKLGMAAWCYKVGTPAYSGYNDYIADNDYSIYTARGSKFNDMSDQQMSF